MIEKTLHEIEHEAWSQRADDYDALFAAVSTQAIDGILDSLGPLQGKRHLDVACGTGHLVAAASRRGAISQGLISPSRWLKPPERTILQNIIGWQMRQTYPMPIVHSTP